MTGKREIDIRECNTINTLPRDLQEYQILKINDILISLTGNVGRVSLCNSFNCLLNQRVGLLFIKNPFLHEYIYQVLSSDLFLRSMMDSAQGAAQLNIGKGDIESFLIPYTEDFTLLNKIASVLYSIDLKIIMEEKQCGLLIRQKDYLMKSLFI